MSVFSSAETQSQLSSVATLPDNPVIVIEPSSHWTAVNVRDLWAHRELLYFLAWRDIKVRYKQTIFGVLWVVMQPTFMTIIFTLVLSRLAGVPSMGGVPYALFAYSGLMLWTFFSGATLTGSQSLLGNSQLITKIYFPRLIIPLAVVGGRLIDLAISLALLAVLMIAYRVRITSSIFLLPFFLLLLVLFALAVSVLTAALTVRYRDIGIALPVLMQLGMYVSPIVYPASLVPAQWQRVYALNPLVGIVDGFRGALFGAPISKWSVNISVVLTTVLLAYSTYLFRKAERYFADVI